VRRRYADQPTHECQQDPAGTSLRFTPDEIEEFRSLGLDFEGARTKDDIEHALTAWAKVLADERPDLLDKIVAQMATVKGFKRPAQPTEVVGG
jgi:hypothetical protein